MADKSKSTDHEELCKPKKKKEKKGERPAEDEHAQTASARNKKKDLEEVGKKLQEASAKGKKGRSASKEPENKKAIKPEKSFH